MDGYDPVESMDDSTVFPYHDLTPPTPRDVYEARRVVRGRLPRTPLVRSEPLSAELDADVYLKRDDTLPTGAFKVRGGVTLAAGLDSEFEDPGLVAASTGNHGQSLAFTGREFDIPVTVVVPADANPEKVTAMEQYGARVVHHGADFDEARERVEALAAEEGFRYVHSANEPDLIAGVGTAGLEVVEDLPSVDLLVCPVGGGSSATGYCLTVGTVADAEVVGVQSAAAPAMYHAWRDGHLDPHDRMGTFAEGLATRVPFALTAGVLRKKLDDFVLVPDREIREAMAWFLEHERLAVEGACAATLAGLRSLDDVAGRNVVLPLSGRNVAPEKLRATLE
jgi:threonine dehydratase